MRLLTTLGLALLFTTALFAQFRGGFGNPTPYVQGSFGNIVLPGGTSANFGVQRTFGNILYPGGGGPRLVVPYNVTDPTYLQRFGAAGRYPSGRGLNLGGYGLFPYTYYVGGAYVGGGFYDNPYVGDGVPPQAPVTSQQPNITVIYPPVQQPMVLSPSNDNNTASAALPPSTVPEATQPAAQTPAATPQEHYLLAFKDRTIYDAVAYYVDGDTLHYFTSGNMHNQVSLSLVDRPLTERLNKEMGVDIHLP